MIKKYILANFFLLLCYHAAKAQSPEKNLSLLRATHPGEQVYIHYDKASYVAGETIWFKAYVMEDQSPSDLSSAINVELIDDSGSIIAKKTLPLIGSAAAGDFYIPIDAPQMNYVVRAYTRHMMNFGRNYFYSHRIAVYNPDVKKRTQPATILPQIYFLPEGGNLVEGLQNSIAFKCTDQYGYPLSCEGTVFDERMKAVTTFETIHDGMGKFDLTPSAGKNYQVVYTARGQKITAALPVVQKDGIALRVTRDGRGQLISIFKKEQAGAAFEPFYLTGVMENTVVFKQTVNNGTAFIQARIPVEKLPSGVLQLTLFNKADQPIAVRSLFVNNSDFLANGELLLDTIATGRHQKNVYTLSVKEPVDGTFSVAITDYDRELKTTDNENIFSRILLSNNIKDKLFNPAYYFEKKDAEHEAAIDLVMMTSAWKRFSWDEILSGRLPTATYTDNNYVSFDGTFYEAGKNTPLVNKTLRMVSNTRDSSYRSFKIQTDQSGNIFLPGMIFTDTATFSFYMEDEDIPVAVTLRQVPLTKLFSYPVQSFAGRIAEPEKSVSPALIRQLYSTAETKYMSRFIALENIDLTPIKNQRRENKRFNHFNNNRPYSTSQPFFGEDMLTLTDIDFAKNNRVYIGNYAIFPYGHYYAYNPALYSNYPFPRSVSYNYPLSIDFDAVSRLVQNSSNVQNDPRYMMNVVRVEGFSPVEEFFSPDYTNGGPAGPDERYTLYWNPYLKTSSDSRSVSISFFNSDEAKKFRIILTGMTADGKLLHIEKIVE